jgi:MFS family permease
MTKKGFLIRFSIVALGYGTMGGLLRYYGLLVRMQTDSKYMIGLALSIGSLVSIFANPYFGKKSDGTWNQMGRRRPYVLASVPACALMIAIVSYIPGYWPLVGCLFLLTFAGCLGTIPFFAMIPDNTISSEQGRIISLFMFIGGIGVMAVMAISWGLWDRNYHLTFLTCVAFLIIFTIPSALTIAEKEPTQKELEIAKSTHQGFTGYLKNILSHKNIVYFFASNFFRQLSIALQIQFILLFAREDLSIAVGTASLCILIQLLIRTLLMPVAGIAADRFERKRLLLLCLFTLGTGTLIFYFWVHNISSFIAMVIFFGIGESMMAVSASTMIMDLLPEGRSGEFLGLNSVMQAIPAAFGAFGGGVVTGLLGQYRAYLLLYAAGLILSALFVIKIKTERPY